MLCFLGTTSAEAQNKVDILIIYQNFLASAVAHKNCGTSDPEIEKKL